MLDDPIAAKLFFVINERRFTVFLGMDLPIFYLRTAASGEVRMR